MGFIIPYEKPSGMVFNYHRISSVTISTNSQNVIELVSYFSTTKRKEETENIIEMMTKNNEPFSIQPIFTDSDFIVVPYDPSMTIDSAYEYVLSLPQFEGAEMEETEFMLDAEAAISEIQEELAENEPTPEETSEEGE